MNSNLSNIKGHALGLWLFLRYVAERFQGDRAVRMAASLSYTSLLSLVPLMAIALAMLAAFPVFDDIRDQVQGWIFANFVPAVGELVQERVAAFIANAGRLTAAGVVGLAVTAVLLLVTIEDAFNTVFRVERERSPLAKLLVYWTLVTLGPLLIGLSLSLQTYLAAASHWALGQTGTALFTMPLPTLLSILAFTILLMAAPNRPVLVRDALIGGTVAGVIFAILRGGFGYYVASAEFYTNVYGAVAALPIFLMWMFLSWTAVLVGAEVTAALPERRAGFHREDKSARSSRHLTVALDVLAALGEASRNGKGGVSRRNLLKHSPVAEGDLRPVLLKLLSTAFIVQTQDKSYVLARDLTATTLNDLLRALDLDLALDDSLAARSQWRPAVEQRINAARAAAHDPLSTALAAMLAHQVTNDPS